MPELYSEYDEEGNVIDPQQPNESRDDYLVRVPRKDIRALETDAKRARDAEQRAADAERRAAFAEAGIPLSSDDERVQFFVQGYQGEATADAIKAKAEALGVLTPPASTPAATPPPAERPTDTPLLPGEAGFSQETRTLATGAPGDEMPAQDPYVAAREVHDKARADGAQEKVALGNAFNSLVNAAHRGDQRVIVPSPVAEARAAAAGG